jgi:thioesterase domain-containing protein
MAPDQQRAVTAQPDILVPLRPSGADAPLFCLPPASGSPAGYQRLAALLPAGRPVWGFECPGFDGSGPPLTSVHDLADEYAPTVRTLAAGQPVHLAGWSMGAIIAFETARRLVTSRVPVGSLVLVDPSPVQLVAPPTEAEVAERFLTDFLGGSDGPAAFRACGRVVTLGDVPPLFAAAQAQGLISDDLDVELIMERYTVFRANTQALIEYAASGRYPGTATLIKADRTPDTSAGWHALIGRIREHRLPADHYSIMLGDAVGPLAGIVGDCLAEAS